MHQEKILSYLIKLNQNTQTLGLVSEIERELSINGETHVSIELQLAIILHRNGLYDEAYNKLMYIVDCEEKNQNFSYNTIYADAIGIAGSFLINHYFSKSKVNYLHFFDLSFLYLSNHIQNFGHQMFDSLNHRALLMDANHNYARSLGSRFLKTFSFIPLPLIISDYYYSAQGYIAHGNLEMGKSNTARAVYLHQFLDDMVVNGKEADQYDLSEMAGMGKEKLVSIYTKMDAAEIFRNFDFEQLIE